MPTHTAPVLQPTIVSEKLRELMAERAMRIAHKRSPVSPVPIQWPPSCGPAPSPTVAPPEVATADHSAASPAFRDDAIARPNLPETLTAEAWARSASDWNRFAFQFAAGLREENQSQPCPKIRKANAEAICEAMREARGIAELACRFRELAMRQAPAADKPANPRSCERSR